jgi:hypothetical protein
MMANVLDNWKAADETARFPEEKKELVSKISYGMFIYFLL